MFYIVSKLEFLALKVQMMLWKLIREAHWCSIDIMLRLECLSCPIYLLVLFLMIFSLLKLRSPDDFVPGREKHFLWSSDDRVVFLQFIFINKASHFSWAATFNLSSTVKVWCLKPSNSNLNSSLLRSAVYMFANFLLSFWDLLIAFLCFYSLKNSKLLFMFSKALNLSLNSVVIRSLTSNMATGHTVSALVGASSPHSSSGIFLFVSLTELGW